MAKVHRCLQITFIVFNGIFACIGAMMMYGTMRITLYSSQISNMGGPGLGWCWAISIAILGIACLGMYAGKSEKPLLLKIFAGFMIVGLIIMMILGVLMAIAKNQIMDVLTNSQDLKDVVMEDQSLKEALDELQLHGHCCGLYGARDWGSSIPDSCDCNYKTEGLSQLGLGESECGSKPLSYSGPSKIYTRPCIDVIVGVLNLVFHLMIGLFFGFAVIALIGLLLSLLMVRQIRRRDERGIPGMAMKGF